MATFRTVNTTDQFYVTVRSRNDGSIKFHDIGGAKNSLNAAVTESSWECWLLQSGKPWLKIISKARVGNYHDGVNRWTIHPGCPTELADYLNGKIESSSYYWKDCNHEVMYDNE